MEEVHRQYHPVSNLFPLMQGADFEALKQDISEHGQLEPIWLHSDGSIIDGRNRHRACIELGIDPHFRTWAGDGSLVSFVVSLNLHRRHLTPTQWATVGVDALPLYEEEARQRQIAAGAAGAEFGVLGGRGNTKPLGENFPQGVFVSERAPRARATAAQIVGVNPRYIQDGKRIKEQAPDVFDKMRTGEVTISEAKRELRKREAEAKRQEVLAKYDQVDVWSGSLNVNTIEQTSIYDLDLPPESVDMIFTDPPYHDKHIDLYGRLAEVAASALKPGCYLLVYAGKMFIPQVIACLSGHLEYVSIFAVFQPFSQARIMKHNIFENWRPILAFKKPGHSPVKEWAQDVVRGTRDKSHHDWQQDSEAPLQYIAAYTKPGDIVLDPFVGGGTTPWACKQLGRYFVAFDVDDEAIKLSQERVNYE